MAAPNTTLTIAAGATLSDSVAIANGIRCLGVDAPATLTGTITVQVEPTSTGAAWATLTSQGSNVTVPAGSSVSIFPITFGQIRLSSSAGEAAARSFTVTQPPP